MTQRLFPAAGVGSGTASRGNTRGGLGGRRWQRRGDSTVRDEAEYGQKRLDSTSAVKILRKINDRRVNLAGPAPAHETKKISSQQGKGHDAEGGRPQRQSGYNHGRIKAAARATTLIGR